MYILRNDLNQQECSLRQADKNEIKEYNFEIYNLLNALDKNFVNVGELVKLNIMVKKLRLKNYGETQKLDESSDKITDNKDVVEFVIDMEDLISPIYRSY
ncbi:41565_t:CDS:2, partial [Gigaspora margarita]